MQLLVIQKLKLMMRKQNTMDIMFICQNDHDNSTIHMGEGGWMVASQALGTARHVKSI